MPQAGEHQNTCIPALQRDLDSLRIEIDAEITLIKPSIDAIQEEIAESITAIEANQLVLKETNSAKGKTKSMETLVRPLYISCPLKNSNSLFNPPWIYIDKILGLGTATHRSRHERSKS